MTQIEVAEFFRVTPHTVNSWIRKGFLKPVYTLGGHKRFHTSHIRTLAGLPPTEPEPTEPEPTEPEPTEPEPTEPEAAPEADPDPDPPPTA